MKTVEVNMRMCTNLYISDEIYEEGIILKFVGEKPDYKDKRHVRIYLANPEEDEKPKHIREIPTIPGHPNCHYGDCLRECHVVSCGIWQGYEEIPTLPPDWDTRDDDGRNA